MREHYIDDKMTSITNSLSNATLARMEKERQVAQMMNKIHREVSEVLKEAEGKMIRYAETLLRDNL